MLLKKQHLNHLYLFGLCVMAAGLPLSNFLMSLSQFMLAAHWLLDGNYGEKLRRFWNNKAAVLFSSIFLLHVAGAFYSDNVAYTLHDLRIKLPILLLPFFIASAKPISKKQFNMVMWIFIGAVLAGSAVSALVLWEVIKMNLSDYRDASLFVSHIRFSLMICIAVFFLFHSIVFSDSMVSRKILTVIVIAWLVYFLFLLKAVVGIIALVAGVITTFAWLVFKSKNKALKYLFTGATFGVLAGTFVYIYFNIREFYDTHGINLESLDEYTESGEKYEHRKEIGLLENGSYVWLYLAWDEMEDSWNARSQLAYNGRDNKGNELYATLIRFLSSKGYLHDANGVEQLTDEEVKAIENGTANVRFMDGMNFNDRVYQIIWEIHIYSIGLNPQGHSVAQRLDFWKTALAIIKKHPLTGVGTGDVKDAFASEYKKLDSRLDEKHRLRAHNQYLTFLVALGIPGLIWFLFALLYPVFLKRNLNNYHYLTFIIIALISMLSEDTIETQAGVSFIAFFNCLFLFGKNESFDSAQDDNRTIHVT